MKKEKMMTVLIASVLTATMLSGCTSSTISTDGTTTGTRTTDEAGQNNPAASQNLTITWWGGEARNQYTQELLDMYSETRPEIKFSATPTSWDGYFEKLSTQAAGGNLPDIVQMDYLYIGTYAKNGTVADLTPFIEDGTIDISNIEDTLIKSGKVGNIQAGIPLSTSMLTISYNPSVVAEAGLENPDSDWTWAEFEEFCLQVKEKTGKYGYSTNYTDVNLLNYWVRQQGERLFNEEGTGVGYSNDHIVADFISMHKRLTDAGAMPTPDEWVTIAANGEEARSVPMGTAATTYSSNTLGVQVAAVNDTIMLNTPPAVEGVNALWLKPGMFFCVAATASPEEQKAAAEFINWFINSEEAGSIVGTERGIPASELIRDYLLNGNLNQKQKEMFAYYDIAAERAGECPPPDPEGISEVNKVFSDIMDQVMYGQLTPEAAAVNFKTKANEILARNK